MNTEIWDDLSKTNLDYHKQEQKQNKTLKGILQAERKEYHKEIKFYTKKGLAWNVKYVDKNKRCLFPMLSYIP